MKCVPEKIIIACVISLTCSACDYFLPVSYNPIATIRDEPTGKYIELAEMNSMSSFGYAVYVFDDDRKRESPGIFRRAIINVAGVGDAQPRFYSKDGCYVLEIEYRWGGLISPKWPDAASGKTICFNLLPDPGPRGGFKP